VYSIPGHCDITVTKIRFMLEFGTEAEYAACGEFGTYKTAARPYIRPALEPAEDPRKKAEGAAVHRGLLSS
jgi:hypothetical protein